MRFLGACSLVGALALPTAHGKDSIKSPIRAAPGSEFNASRFNCYVYYAQAEPKYNADFCWIESVFRGAEGTPRWEPSPHQPIRIEPDSPLCAEVGRPIM